MVHILAFASLVGEVAALVLDARHTSCHSITDTYEGLTTVPGAPQLSAVGELNGLDYNGWVAAASQSYENPVGEHGSLSVLINGLQGEGLTTLSKVCLGKICLPIVAASGTRPHSGAQVAATGIIETLTQIGENTLHPFGTIKTSSDTNSFSMSSFYFGCLVNVANSIVVPSSGCTITVTGFYIDGVQAPSQTFSFSATKIINATLALAVLSQAYSAPSVGLQNVTIGLASADFSATLAVLVIDDLVHCNRASS